MQELIFRYGLPGLPVSLVVYPLLFKGISDKLGILIAIGITLLFSYYIQQFWMLIFERILGGYSHSDRKVSREIKNIIQSEENDDKELFRDKAPYHVWDTMLYSDAIPEGIRQKDRAMWHSYHMNIGNATGVIIGASIITYLLITDVFQGRLSFSWDGDMDKRVYIVFSYLVASSILITKANSTRSLVDDLEEHWAHFYFKKHVRKLTAGETDASDETEISTN